MNKVERSTRSKRRVRGRTAYYYKHVTDKNNKVNLSRSRGDYFTVLRRDRTVMKIIHNTAVPKNFTKRNLTTVRRVYYRILPFLFCHLRWQWDLSILRDIEATYYYWLNRAAICRGAIRRVNRLPDGLRFID